MMRKIIYGFLGFIALVISAALLVPLFVDLDGYKAEISQKARETLGRDLQVEGPIKLSLLPGPSITLKKVTVSNTPGAQTPHILSLDKVRVDVGLLPLLKKQIQIVRVQLVKPLVNLEKLKDGTSNWVFDVKSESSRGAPPSERVSADAIAQPSNAAAEGEDFSFSFDHVEVIKAHIYYRDATTVHEIKDLTAQLQIEDLKGPLKAEGFLKVLEQDIRFDLEVKEIAHKIPLKLELDSSGVEIDLEGDFNQEEATFQGDLVISGDTRSIEKATQNRLKLPSFLGDTLELSGYVKASEQAVEIQNLNLKADDTKLKGHITARFSPLTFTAHIRGLPGQVALSLSGKPQKTGLSGDVELTLSSPGDFFEWANLKGWPEELASTRLEIQGAFYQKGDSFGFSDLSAELGSTTVAGRVSYNSQSHQIHYDLKGANLESLGHAFDVTSGLHISTLALKGRSRLDTDQKILTTQASLALPGGRLSLEGDLKLDSLVKPVFDLKTRIFLTDPKAFLKVAPFDKLDFKARLKHDGLAFTTEGLSFTAYKGKGKVTLKGATRFDLLPKPKLTGALTLGELDVSAFLSSKTKGETAASGASGATSQSASSGTPATRIPWSSDPLNLSFLKDFDGEISLSCPALVFEDHALENLATTLSLQEGVLQMPALTGQIHKGKFNMGLSIEAGTRSVLKMRANLDDLSLKRALSKVKEGNIRLIQGNLDGVVNLMTAGESVRDFVSNLEGLVNVKATEGVVDGFDLKSVSQKLKSLNTLNAFMGLFQSAMTQGQTKFSEFALALGIHKGVGKIEKMVLLADGGEGRGSGHLNLPQYTIDVFTEFRLTDHEDLPSFKMALKGPLDAPEKQFDTRDLEAYLLKNVFKKVLAGVAGGPLGVVVSDLIGGLTGGGDSSQSQKAQKESQAAAGAGAQKKSGAEAASQEDAPSAAEEIITAPAKAVENLIKGLF